MNKVLKTILPKSYTLNTMEKPMHSGEIYHLWESLTVGYQIISMAETFQMNTEDKKLHLLLQGIVKGTQLLRINKLEDLLKDAGFTVPPRPASKTLQGKPGVGQEVTVSDEESIKVLFTFIIGVLNLDGRGVGTSTTNKKIRNVFVELLNDDMRAYETILNLAEERKAINAPPPATSATNSLNMGEVYWLWFQLEYRHSAILELETFLNNTDDTELLDLIKYGLNKISYPELNQVEEILKREGFTVPARPVNRTGQQPKGTTNRIVLKDSEVISMVLTATQIAINNHIRAFSASFRGDITNMYKNFISIEIDNMERILNLAVKRNLLEKPPFVTSKRG